MSDSTNAQQDESVVDGARVVDPNNRTGLDYREQARLLGPPPCPIIDIHAHISGERASQLYKEVADLFGIEQVFSMVQLENAPIVQEVLGDRVNFIAVPQWQNEDRRIAFGPDFLERIERFHDMGARLIKFFVAPRMRELEEEIDAPGLFALDSPLRIEAAELAERLGMGIMTHVADPDTWFAAKYSDASRYGTKRDQYVPLERMLERFAGPWIAAHMGGSPEDLDFLDDLLDRHDNLHLDTSACKWMLRELGAHTNTDMRSFFEKWRTRLLFGSDILTMDEHLESSDEENPWASKASGAEQAFDLYASRYYSLRMMFEGTGSFESPITDPDLHMIDPTTYKATDAPEVRCHGFDRTLLCDIYRNSATTLMSLLGIR